MRKRTSDRKRGVGSVKLCRKDVEEIIGLANDYVYDNTLSDAEYDYDNLDDLEKTRGIIIRDFSITAFAIGTKFKLNISLRNGSILEVTNKDDFYLQLVEFLKKKKRIGLGIILHTFLVLSMVGFFFLPRVEEIGKPLAVLFLLVSTILLAAWYAGSLSVVYLNPKHELPSGWKQHKDIWILILSNVLTALTTIVVAYILLKQGIKQ